MSSRHANAPTHDEYTLCGFAVDAHETGDHSEPIVFAKPGETINCPECRVVINYCKSIKRWREPEAQA